MCTNVLSNMYSQKLTQKGTVVLESIGVRTAMRGPEKNYSVDVEDHRSDAVTCIIHES